MAVINYASWAAVAISLLALLFGGVALAISKQGNRAAIFERRFEVYEDVMKFINAWARHGTPDMGLLPMLVGAWDRSHFLFGSEVTNHIRLIWTDATQANYLKSVISRDSDGDRTKAIKDQADLFKKHNLEHDLHRRVFMKYLKI